MQIFLQIIKYIHKYDLSLSYNCVKLEGGIVCQQPFPVQGHSGLGQVHTGCDLPVLADLLSFKTGLESRTDDTLINSNT
jgi:hypothetical protein